MVLVRVGNVMCFPTVTAALASTSGVIHSVRLTVADESIGVRGVWADYESLPYDERKVLLFTNDAVIGLMSDCRLDMSRLVEGGAR